MDRLHAQHRTDLASELHKSANAYMKAWGNNAATMYAFVNKYHKKYGGIPRQGGGGPPGSGNSGPDSGGNGSEGERKQGDGSGSATGSKPDGSESGLKKGFLSSGSRKTKGNKSKTSTSHRSND